MAAYATPADLILQYDERTIADLCKDDGVSETDISTNTAVLWALERATGAIKAAIYVGSIYTEAQIDTLAGESLVLLKAITCELAMIYLIMRRPEKYLTEQLKDARQAIDELLDRFRKGERMFDLDSARGGGEVTIDGPTANDYQRLNMIPSRTKNFYPQVGTRLPIGRGGS